MKILFTGFEPFGNEPCNPSMDAVNLMPDEIEGAQIAHAILPTARIRSLEILRALISEHKPDVIISVGVAGGRNGISVERAALNIDDFTIADNDGSQPEDVRIFADGPDAYFSKLPVKKILSDMQKKGIAAHVSNSAGTFVCNHVFYGCRYICEHDYPAVRSGFIHVPYCDEQKKEGMPSMPLAEIVRALKTAAETVVRDQICQSGD